ncbi:DUF500-domain-containing protein [Nemania sp. NC0429]|nr:DUF500-domain-containing protein [Nemania sp. NC0429]
MNPHPQHTGPAGHGGSNEGYYSNDPVELPAHEPADARPAQSHPRPAAVDAGIPPPPPPPPPSGLPPPSWSSSPPPPPPPPVAGHEQQPQVHKETQPYFPPPPPGPPPAPSSHGQQEDYYYYPPPPPGPPPGFGSVSPPPGYAEEFGEGPGNAPGDVKIHDHDPHGLPGANPPGPDPAVSGPPALPPRPVSSGVQFAPPPTSPAQDGGHGRGAGSRFGEKLYQWSVKAGAPVNRIAHRLGAEAFWPMTLDLECEKAARILRSFCKDGFYTATGHGNASNTDNNKRPSSPSSKPQPRPTSPNPRTSSVLVKIPASVIAGAKGLAIFTTFRTGFHVSGAAGSGVVVARLPDGSWSPPAGFLVHTLGAGLMIGIDVYDCVCVLRTRKAVDAFARRARVSLGGEIGVTAGPVGAGGAVEGVFDGRKRDKSPRPAGENGPASHGAGTGAATAAAAGTAAKDDENGPVWMYMKSRGFYVGVQADGTVIIPRADANAAFYGEQGITVERILTGQVPVHHATQAQTQEQAHGQVQGQTHAVEAGGKAKGKERELVMWPEGGRQLSEVLKAIEGKGADAKILRELAQGPTPGDVGPPPAPHHLDGGKA